MICILKYALFLYIYTSISPCFFYYIFNITALVKVVYDLYPHF